jgi:multidrug resistance efflux pump
VAGAVLLGFGAVGFIPMGSSVGGKGILHTLPGQRQSIVMPTGGIVRLEFNPNQPVQDGQPMIRAGQPLITIHDRQLLNRIQEVERSLQQEEAALAIATERLDLAQRQLNNAIAQRNQAQVALDRHRLDLEAMQFGPGTPETRQIEEEQRAIETERFRNDSRIQGLQAQIRQIQRRQITLESQLQRHRTDLVEFEKKMARLEPLFQDNTVSALNPRIQNLSIQISDLNNKIDEKEGEYHQNQEQIVDLETQIENQEHRSTRSEYESQARGEQRNQVVFESQRELITLQNAVQRQQGEVDAKEREVLIASQQVNNHQEAIDTWQATLKELQDDQEDLTQYAEISGDVLESDLDLIDNAYVPAGEEVLSLANLNFFQVKALISQADRTLVRKGQPVKFSVANQPPGITYEGIVNDIRRKTDNEEAGVNPVFEVTFTIDNPEGYRLPDDEGNVKITTAPRNLYQKINHQLGKLIDFSRF